jgi:hypothetical protein
MIILTATWRQCGPGGGHSLGGGVGEKVYAPELKSQFYTNQLGILGQVTLLSAFVSPL